MKDPVRLFQFVLFALCIGLLGAIPFITSLPKPAEAPQASIAPYPQRQVRSGAWDATSKFANDYNVGKYRDVITDAAVMEKANALDATSAIITAQAYYKDGDYAGCVKYIRAHFYVPPVDSAEKFGRPVISQLFERCQKT